MRLEPVARRRPITLVRPSVEAPGPFPQVAPFCTVLCETHEPVRLSLSSGGVVIEGIVEGRASVRVTVDGRTTVRRPRRHRRKAAYDAVALTLTGTHATVLTRTAGAWTGRARVDLADLGVDTHAPGFLAGLCVGGSAPFVAGPFGQLGLRDLRVVTRADGSPYTRREGEILLTATSAGPGFFDTAHTSVWAMDVQSLAQAGELGLTHLSDLFFRRGGKVYGDHATHLLRVEDEWLVATSTWGDFDGSGVGVTLSRSSADLLDGTHVLDSAPLHLPTSGHSVGVWDPHLVRVATGATHGADAWVVGYVSATQVSPRFRFHPVVATGPSLELLELRAARPDRIATEGTTIVRVSADVTTEQGSSAGPQWRVLASDGRDNPRATRARFPVFDLDLEEVGTLDADYLSNLPWPTLVTPGSLGSTDAATTGTLMITFDGTPSGGRLLGYGTHGDVVVLKSTQSSSGA